MKNVQLLILLAFIALFGAGAVSALVAQRYVGRPPAVPQVEPKGGPEGGSFLKRKLGLSDEQFVEFEKFWSDAREKGQANWELQRSLRQQRDDELKKLMTAEQLKAAEEITKRYEERQAKIRQENEANFKAAEEKAREILTPEQRVKYEEFLKQAKERGERGGPRRGGGPGSRPGGGMGGGPGGPGGPPPGR